MAKRDNQQSKLAGKTGVKKKISPMVQQWNAFKAEHPDAMLLFRVGDFFETFGDDAKLAAEILNITLTKRSHGPGREGWPLAGIPYHALENYIGKLVAAGVRVAICDQVGPTKGLKANEVVKREVTRIVTPGTVIEENLLEDKSDNCLIAVARHGGNWGLAACDLSTGALAATEFSGDDARTTLISEVARIQPAEMLAIEDDQRMLEEGLRETFGAQRRLLQTRVDEGMVRLDRAREALLEQLGVATLQGFGAEDSPAAISASGALVTYLLETQRRGLGHIQSLQIYSVDDHMVLDAVTQRSLELTANLIDGSKNNTLLEVLDHTRTPMGGRKLRQWITRPLQNLDAIRSRQDGIESLLMDAAARSELNEALRGVRDLERIVGRIHCNTANARDLVALSTSLREAPAIKTLLMRTGAGRLRDIGEQMRTLADLADELENALNPDPPVSIREGGMIRDGHHAELDELRGIAKGGKDWIAQMRAREIERTGIPSLKIGYNKVFGYYIEITNAHKDKAPEDWIRRQTLTNGERYITPELKEQEEKILGAQDKIHELEGELFEALRERVKSRTQEVQTLAQQIASVDVIASLAEVALRGHYVRPTVDESDTVHIEAGRHPVLEAIMSDRPFVANDVHLSNAMEQIWLITGPNMAGKSTFIRQVAIITLMAHIGAYVPARAAKIGLVDRIFTRVGATDYLARGQSTFLVEMTETANILNNASPRSLVILDEIGRGTSTYDGLSIAWAVVEYLHDKPRRRAKTLFATHYHELTDLEGKLERVRNYSVAVKENDEGITFLYRIAKGGADRSYGIFAAQLAGMPRETLDRAKEILFRLECHQPAGDDEVIEVESQPTPHYDDDPQDWAGEGGSVSSAAIGGYPASGHKGPKQEDEGQGNSQDSAGHLQIPGPQEMSVNLPENAQTQPDMFTPSLPAEFDELKKMDLNHMTPIQAWHVLDQVIRLMRQM